jgi:hypothetical protein
MTKTFSMVQPLLHFFYNNTATFSFGAKGSWLEHAWVRVLPVGDGIGLEGVLAIL